jgi:hypothetical protein
MGKPISNKWISFSLHAIAWAIVIIIPLYLNSVFGDDRLIHLFRFYVNTFFSFALFYLGYFWLVPRYFLKDKKLTYVLLLVGLITATYFISSYFNEKVLVDPAEQAQFKDAIRRLTDNDKHPRPPFKAFGIYNHILTSLLISGFAMGLGVMEKLKQNEKKQKELEKEKLNSELQFLKNQVSPHFFFNTLNNIYTLIGIDGSTAQESVLKLSKLMRYLLYESEHGETLLRHEIDFMNNYIDLMKLRLSPKVDLQIDFPKEFPDYTIPPLLFIPFIENAFKHGVSHRERSFIHVGMTIQEGAITFVTTNSIGRSSQPGDMQHSGIGLENVKKRLHLLFPERHNLSITKSETEFSVELTIQKNTNKV